MPSSSVCSSTGRAVHAHRIHLGYRLLCAFAVAAAVLLSQNSRAWGADSPTQAPLLVASPKLADAMLGRSVIAVAPLPSGGHVGIIVNRPTENRLAQLFPDHEPSRRVSEPVYYGGPFSTNAIIALVHAAASPGTQAIAIARGVFLAVDAPTVDRVIEQHPDEARFFVGYVVWAPAQLEEQLAAGLWTLRRVDATTIFRKDTRSLWHELTSTGLVAHTVRAQGD